MTPLDIPAARENAERWLVRRDGSRVTRDEAIGEENMAHDVLAALSELEQQRRRVQRLEECLVDARDALANLRAGRWEIGYVKERVDRVLAAVRKEIL